MAIVLSHYASVLPHEFAHSITAWTVGIKDQPFAITWGGGSPANVLLLIDIDENVDYTAALDAGHHWQAALTAFAGPGIAATGLYLASRWAITKPFWLSHPVAANLLFWFLLMCLGNVSAYLPTRVFASHADVHNFIAGTGANPWVVYVVGNYLVLWAVVDFYRKVMPLGLRLSEFRTATARAVTLIAMTVFLFGYFANPSLLVGSDVRAQILAATSMMTIAPIVILQWRRLVLAPLPPLADGRPTAGPGPGVQAPRA
ncbi:hypothetical protein [Nakamurella endophytica]|uniref:hypothetical protein n=1 Tax=Nakamurella endophytica TaxID=1748367 RepID=UPI0016687759|nr:hypothetical protein [Nakamurella endophytica]